jgi:hypothetical protein
MSIELNKQTKSFIFITIIADYPTNYDGDLSFLGDDISRFLASQ